MAAAVALARRGDRVQALEPSPEIGEIRADIWVGPKCHLVHCPLCGDEQCIVVGTFHLRQIDVRGVTEGSKDAVQTDFLGTCPKARQLVDPLRS